MVKIFLVDPRFRGLRVLVVAIALTSLTTFVYQSIPFSCQLIILQNAILPFIVVHQFLRKIDNLSVGDRIKTGLLIGGLVGALVAAFSIIISKVHYYFLGDRVLASNLLGVPVTTLTPESIIGNMWTSFYLWIFFIILSVIFGLLGAIRNLITQRI